MSEPRVYWRHVQAARLCGRGARAWAARHGVDWMDFMRNGIAESELAAWDNAFADRVIEIARAEREADNG